MIEATNQEIRAPHGGCTWIGCAECFPNGVSDWPTSWGQPPQRRNRENNMIERPRLDLCCECVRIVYDPTLLTRTSNGNQVTRLSRLDAESMMISGEPKIIYQEKGRYEGVSVLEMVAMVTMGGSRFCGPHSIKPWDRPNA